MLPDVFIDPISVAVIATPILLAIALLGEGSWKRRGMLCRDLGIPVGTLFALIGMGQMLTMKADMGAIYGATAVMLLVMFYGGLISVIGFFLESRFSDSNRNGPVQSSSIARLALAIIALFACVAYSALNGSSWFFLDGFAAAVWSLFLIAALLFSSKESRVNNVARALLFQSMVCVVAGIIVFFTGDQGPGLSFAINGLIYGLISYVILYLACFQRGASELINAPLTNWHWMEVTGFFTFMFLAPDTILDNLQDAAIADRFEALEQKVQDLQRDLDNIDG